jgi:gluconolactonase
MSTLVAAAEPTVLAHALGFVEGPIWTADGRLLVASMNRGRIYAINPAKGGLAVELAETGGGPNCLAQAPDGSVWITQTAGAVMTSMSELPVRIGLQRLEPTTGAVDQVPLAGVDSPSDCVVDQAGVVWFTDPPVHDVKAAPPTGAVRTYDPETGRVTTVAEGLAFPNGLDFSADEQYLFVAETSRRRVLRFARQNGRLQLTGWVANLPSGYPDGIAVDSVGGVWVAGSLGANLCYFDPDGVLQGEIRFAPGSLVTSVCFFGERLDRLAIANAMGGQVASIRPSIPGIPRRSSR